MVGSGSSPRTRSGFGRLARAAVGAALFVGGSVLFWHFADQAAQSFGWTGTPGHLTLTDCRHQSGGGEGGGIVQDCHGRFVSSDGGTTNSDMELTTSGNGHEEGDVVSVRDVHGTAVQVSVGNGVVDLIPAFLGGVLLAVGGTTLTNGPKGSTVTRRS